MNEQDKQLKELYDALDSEYKKKEMEYEFLKIQQRQIDCLLNSYGVPAIICGKKITLLERINLAINKVAMNIGFSEVEG